MPCIQNMQIRPTLSSRNMQLKSLRKWCLNDAASSANFIIAHLSLLNASHHTSYHKGIELTQQHQRCRRMELFWLLQFIKLKKEKRNANEAAPRGWVARYSGRVEFSLSLHHKIIPISRIAIEYILLSCHWLNRLKVSGWYYQHIQNIRHK